ncbi:MAG TPA: 3D domain-containing protein [Longimicrobium sp.]|jgi:3D (Asp-Asp-Asp) domain-containing protein
MQNRVVQKWPADRSPGSLYRLLAPAGALVVSGILIGVWACAPRVARSGAGESSIASAAAANLRPETPAPAEAPQPQQAAAPAPAPEPDPHVQRIQDLEQALARALAASNSGATDADVEAAARRAFPVAQRIEMSSTMYCLKGEMRTGVRTRDGMAAGDPRVLPLGSVVRVTHPDGRPIGIFTIMDTGGAIRGNKIDIYVDSCREAERWGRRPAVVEVLAIGRASPGDLR